VALKHGITGVGVNQKGGARFIHLDDLEPTGHFPRPTIWSY
jgi:zinc D-Ala-D-Ala carboxypeptidase